MGYLLVGVSIYGRGVSVLEGFCLLVGFLTNHFLIGWHQGVSMCLTTGLSGCLARHIPIFVQESVHLSGCLFLWSLFVSLGFGPSRSLSSQGCVCLPVWGSFYVVQNLLAYE